MLPPSVDDPNLLVGLDTSDDAGVYRLNDETALIQTVDFFTPIVDNPYSFGQIAAANALSDVYAMGGRPLTAMNLIGFPTKTLGLEVLAEILKGGADKVKEAGALLVGGHSVEDNEPKYGLSVTGVVHPDKVLTNAGAKPGDLLVLTKPVGVGIITTAMKAGMASKEAEQEVIEVMARLNNTAGEIMQEIGVNACTDVTGFGLLGHALEMAKASCVKIDLFAEAVPVLKPAWEYIKIGLIPGGTRRNLKYAGGCTEFEEAVSEEEKLMLADTVTSGGLLISLAAEKAGQLIEKLREAGVNAAIVGQVISGNGVISVYKESRL